MVWFADFETVTKNTNYFKLNNDTKVWLWYIKSFDEKNEKLGLEINDFWEFIKKLDHDTLIYFHNLTWDGDFILKYLTKIGFHIANFDDEIKDKTITVFRRGNKIYSIKCYFNKKCLKFQCSYLILNSSIDQLGKSINIKKLKLDDEAFYDVEPVEHIDQVSTYLIDYIKNDVLISLRSFKNFKNLLEKIDSTVNIHDHLTIGSLGRYFIRQYGEEKAKINTKTYKIASELFRGGFTQFNKKYQNFNINTDDLTIIDVNSAYPYFLSQKLPYKLSKTPVEGSNIEVLKLKLKGTLKPQYSNIYTFWNFQKHNPLFREFRYINEIDETEIYLFNFELETYNKFYDLKYEILERHYCYVDDYLNDFMNVLFDLKNHYKQTKEEGFLKCVKIFLNCVYGSMCLQSDYENFIYFKNDDFKPFITKFLYVKTKKQKTKKLPHKTLSWVGDSFKYNIRSYQCYRFTELAENENHTNKLSAAFVTASQRCKLFNTILNLTDPNEQWIYADTDSLFLHKLKRKDKDYINSLISSKLGDWDYEVKDGKGNFSIYGAKKYNVEVVDNKGLEFIKQKFAGINRPINFRALERQSMINNACLITERWPSGLTLELIDKNVKKGNL